MFEFITENVASLGGILLVIGAYFVYRGDIFKSVMAYFLADIVWVTLAFNSGDMFGSGMIVLGTSFGLAAFIKMNFGKMRKTLDL